MKSLVISTNEQEKLIQHETERRRTLRLLQTRQIEKHRAAQLRQTVADEKRKQTYLLINQLKDEWVQEKMDLHENLEYQFRENLMEMGKGHQEAADQPDYENEWLSKALENDARAIERGQQALDQLHGDMMQNENERNLHILHRKAALELEKVRAQRIAKLPVPEDPLRDLQTKPTTVVTVHDPYNFTTSRYHLEERLVTKEVEQQADAAQDAVVEQERVDAFVSDKERLWSEQQEKARVRGDNALKREVLDNAYDNVLDDLGKLERQDRERRQKEIQNLPKSIFIPPWRREEEREEKQRQMETVFEQVYQETHRKQPIPIVLMTEEDVQDDDAASDRTLVAQDDAETAQPEYRMASVTPSANTVPVVDEVQDEEEATLADPTLMTLQTPLPEQQTAKDQQQQNMNRLLEKIERQRRAAQSRSAQQPLVTPTNKTPKRLVVSPGYAESVTTLDSSATQPDVLDEHSSSNTTSADIEERRAKLESRKQALEEQIRILSQRATAIPQNCSFPLPSSSSDLSIESLLKNLRANSNAGSIPSTSSSIFAGRQHDDDQEQFLQAVHAIVTSDESHLPSSCSSSSSGIAVEDDDRSHETTSDEINRDKFLLDKYESHSSDDRDHSLEDLISRLIATQQQSHQDQSKSHSNPLLAERLPAHGPTMEPPMMIDDLVDDVLSSISSLSLNTAGDLHSISPESTHLPSAYRLDDNAQALRSKTTAENHFYEEKRLIERELESIRREREALLNDHENHRPQSLTSSVKQPVQPPPPPSLLRAKLNLVATNEAHELSTIQEVDTPVSSRNTSLFHHRSPLKSSFDQQQLERISSADSSSSVLSSEHNALLCSQLPFMPMLNQQALTGSGLERDDSGISLVDGPRSSATSRTTLAGGHGGGGGGGGGGRSVSSGIQSLLNNARQPRIRTITNETTTTNTSTSANMPVVLTTPRSNTESDEQSMSSVSRKWRDILANECLPHIPPLSTTSINLGQDDQTQPNHPFDFRSSTVLGMSPIASNGGPADVLSTGLPTQEQFLRSQYDNDQCDLMSLIKVHEYLTKQQHPSSSTSIVEPMAPSSATPPLHQQSYSTLTSVTYLSSLGKRALTTGPPISTASNSSSENLIHHLPLDGNDRRHSSVSDIHHLARSPNTFETSITSHSSLNSNKHQDTLSYLIEQNQRAMQRLISGHNDNVTIESTTFHSSASMRAADYESGPLATTLTSEQAPQKSTLIETGSLSTVDFPSAILLAEEQLLYGIASPHYKMDADDRGILEEPSLTLLSNSYRSLTTTAGQASSVIGLQSASQQKKKQCSSPLSMCDDKTSACSTPSLSPIKKEPFSSNILHGLATTASTNRHETLTTLYLAIPAVVSRHSPSLAPSSNDCSLQQSSEKTKAKPSSNETSLSSFERHELSAGNDTMVSTDEQNDLKFLEVPSPFSTSATAVPRSEPRLPSTDDWSYFITVGETNKKEVEEASSSSSSSSGSAQVNAPAHRHFGGFEFFIDDQQNDASAPRVVQLPSLQSALQMRRADFVVTSQKRIDEIKAKDYSTPNIPHLSLSSRSKTVQLLSKATSISSSACVVETDPEARQRRVRESKERSKRLYDQSAEVQQKKKFQATKQQAQAYRARMSAFQTALDKKKTTTSKKP